MPPELSGSVSPPPLLLPCAITPTSTLLVPMLPLPRLMPLPPPQPPERSANHAPTDTAVFTPLEALHFTAINVSSAQPQQLLVLLVVLELRPPPLPPILWLNAFTPKLALLTPPLSQLPALFLPLSIGALRLPFHLMLLQYFSLLIHQLVLVLPLPLPVLLLQLRVLISTQILQLLHWQT